MIFLGLSSQYEFGEFFNPPIHIGLEAFLCKEEFVMKKIVNCTPHMVNIVTPSGVIDIAPSGVTPRCSQSNEVLDTINGIQITRQTFGSVVDLPPQEEGVLLIVSRLVAAACPDRSDLLIPGPLVRGEDGQPIGCQGLSVL